MRAEQAMMIGVGLIGAYAVYRLTIAKPAAPEPGAFGIRGLTNPNDGSVDTSLPTQAGAPDPAPIDLSLLNGNPISLRGGAYYKARIEVDPRLTNAQIQQLSSSALNVPPDAIEVFRTPAEAGSANGIGQPWSLARAGQGTRWIRFRVGALNSGVRNRPGWLIVLWQAAPPNNIVSGARTLAFHG